MEEYVRIYRVVNGYLIKIKGEDGKDVFIGYTTGDTYDDKEERKQECERISEMLWDILSSIGFTYSKHQPYNISIEVENNQDEETGTEQNTGS